MIIQKTYEHHEFIFRLIEIKEVLGDVNGKDLGLNYARENWARYTGEIDINP